MFDMLRKAMMAGVGMAVMTKERVEEMAREMASASEMSSEKGEEFVAEAMRQAEKARNDFEARVAKVVQSNLDRTGVATKADIEAVMNRLARLESKLNQ
ncbi:MAG: phasin family protein [Phycisphaerae bacterium]